MRKNSYYIALFIVSFSLCFSQKYTKPATKRLFRADELKDKTFLSNEDLILEISFLDTETPLKKGFWFFSSNKIKIVLELINNSDSMFFIEPPSFVTTLSGNPIFTLKNIKDDKILFPEDLTVVNLVPSKFVKLQPHQIYRDTVDILDKNSYNFEHGGKYTISAIYYCQWAAFLDKQGKMQKIWHGKIKSNTINFRYPD